MKTDVSILGGRHKLSITRKMCCSNENIFTIRGLIIFVPRSDETTSRLSIIYERVDKIDSLKHS